LEQEYRSKKNKKNAGSDSHFFLRKSEHTPVSAYNLLFQGSESHGLLNPKQRKDCSELFLP
jgi:hypothetical protein